MKKEFQIVMVFLFVGCTSIAQNVAKTITFNSFDIAVGSCYIGADGGAAEDPAIVIDCASGGRLFSAEWGVQITAPGNYTLPSAWGGCPLGSAFVIDPVNSIAVTTLNVSVQTMEGDDYDCNNNADVAVDDCVSSSVFLLDITAGAHSFSVGSITYNYTVSEVASMASGLTCGLNLPIDLLGFSAIVLDDKSVMLDWETVSEVNNDYFTIEKSKNGINWKEVTRIDGVVNSSSLLSYSFIDDKPYSRISYYRLKQTDFDGEFSYFNILSVNNQYSIKNEIEIYPNPTSSKISLIGDSNELEIINVYNILGENVTNQTLLEGGTEKMIVDLSKLSSGTYYIRTKTTVNKVYKQ